MQESETGALTKIRARMRATGFIASTVIPLTAILAIALITGLLLDQAAALERGLWPEPLYWIARQTTNLAKSGWILVTAAVVIGVFLIVAKKAALHETRALGRRVSRVALYIFLTVSLSGVTVNLAKRLIGRARPEFFSDNGILGRSMFSGADFESFPSGHATTAGAVAGCLAIVFPRARFAIVLVGALLAMTRVIVGAHFPSDVVAGFGYGLWFSIMTAHQFRNRGYELTYQKR